MAAGNNFKDWPTLSDATSSSASAPRSEGGGNSKDCPILNESRNCQTSAGKKKELKARPGVCDSGMENPGTSMNCNTTRPPGKKRDKKRGGKTKWSPVPKDCNLIGVPSYRDIKNERHFDEYNKFPLNGRRSRGSGKYTNNSANGHESSKGRGYRGGRHGQYSQFRSHYESAQGADCRRYPRVPQDATAPEESLSTDERMLIRKVITQIEYYFSEKNLQNDTFVRSHMDKEGYVQLSLVATFNRLRSITENRQIILKAVEESLMLEVSGAVWDDVKIRPIVDPLKWLQIETIPADVPFYVALPQCAYRHMPPFKCDGSVNNSFPYQYPPNEDENKSAAVLFPVNGYYPANLDVPNGYACSSDQHNPPNSDLSNELSSQCMPNDCQNESTSVNEIPSDIDPNDSSTVGSSDLPNGHAHSSDQHISSFNGDLYNECAYQCYPNDYQKKNGPVFNPLNRIHPHVDSYDISAAVGNLNISNQHVCSSEINVSNYFEQISNVIMMDNGRYYIVPSNEILANNSNHSSEDKSTLHNKSPEPSR